LSDDHFTVDASVSREGEHVEGLTADNFAVFDNIEQLPLEAFLVLTDQQDNARRGCVVPATPAEPKAP
jgi:hypothetical protein